MLFRRWTCLLNPPKGKNHVVLNSEITHTFTMDEQCRMEYGDGFVCHFGLNNNIFYIISIFKILFSDMLLVKACP